MISILLCIAALAGCFAAGRRSLSAGIGCVLLVGYVYGIIRANQLDGFSHVLFDAALVGLYAARFLAPSTASERIRVSELRTWLVVLMGWPVMLFLVPRQDLMVELVGLRGNVFMLPCLLLGARLTRDDMLRLTLWVAALNIAAAGVAAAEFVVGIEPFFPKNAVTQIMYRSGDIANFSAHRIPSTFTSAHAYGGAMVLSLPILLGAWMDPATRGPRSTFYAVAIMLSVLAVFVCGARSPVLQLFLIAAVGLLSGRIRVGQKVRWVLVALIAAWVVSGEVRLQRFTTLKDADFLAERIQGSVNLSILELARTYPLGNGLGGGGTSVPYFLQSRIRNSVIMENEYARILLELGIPGLVAWLLFLVWFFTRPIAPSATWPLARRLVRAATATSLGLGLLGVGLFTSIPGTAIMLLAAGWAAVPERQVERQPAERRPAPARASAPAVAWRYGAR